MSSARRVFILALAAVAGVLPAFFSPAHAAGCDGPVGQFAAALNTERAAAGLSPLTVAQPLGDYADVHSAEMAAAGNIFHTSPLLTAAADLDGWSLLGENVGMGGNVDALMDAFMASPSHRENVLNPDYTFVGVGVMQQGATLYTTHVFMAGGEIPAAALGLDCVVEGFRNGSGSGHFTDDDGNPHEERIEAIAAAGITSGCADGLYCPDQVVTRAQMAVFLLRALDLSGASPPAVMADRFADDEGEWAEDSINAVAQMGVTSGCAPTMFCPNSPVTRAEMAVFIAQALHLPEAIPAGFGDTAGHWAARSIDALAAAGITSGSAPGVFSPNAPVTRGEMATFLYRAFLAS